MTVTASIVVVYESMFGDAQRIAEAVARGLADAGTVTCLEVSAAPDLIDASVTLVVAGGPTHGFGLTRPESRADAAARGPTVSTGRGLREWLQVVRPVGPTAAAVFDTRMAHPRFVTVMDHAAHTAAKHLRRAGFAPDLGAEHFLVEDVTGPLAPGEVERAEEWGRALGAVLAARSG